MTEFEIGLAKICTPVLAGSAQLTEVSDRISAGSATAEDAEILREVAGNVNSLWERLRAAAVALETE